MAILLGLVVAVAYGSADFVGGVASRRLPTGVVIACTQTAGLVSVAIAALLLGGHASTADLLRGAGAGVTGLIGLSLLYRGLSRGLMSVVAPITAVGAGAMPVLWGVATGERPTPLAWVGVAVALAAVALISREPTGGAAVTATPTGEIVLALVAGAAFGGVFILLGQTSSGAGALPVLAARCVTVPIAITWSVRTVRRATEDVRPSRRELPLLALGGFLDCAANVVFVEAARHGLLSEVAVVSALYPGSTVVLARIVLGERLGRVQQLGLALALGGVVLIAL